ncbi:MAG: hypothetical protein OJJ21_16960 [Ferrovibrio sp.]|uniref:hypothetical protein n=1 Tax=Ferrovibrio sp. TaxID=1917215 RepID=UPI0026170C74|nr:hypothetical protein [Ferrovibrio sp.]MCW0235292.1 hypothetical protein [Ferrovibrio sp.]
MNRTVFFDRVRVSPFGGSLSQAQVNGLTTLIDAAGKYGVKDVRHLAYALATTFHETARTMQPIAEYGRGKGKKYGVKGKYGQVAYGRGYVQLTWDENYERADKELGLGGSLLKNFDLALRPDIAAAIMFKGMAEGWFTGRKLVHYFSAQSDDPVNARRIINGTDKARTISDYHAVFLAALMAAGWGAVDAPVAAPVPAAAVVPTAPEPVLDTKSVGVGSLLSALISILLTIFKRSAKR